MSINKSFATRIFVAGAAAAALAAAPVANADPAPGCPDFNPDCGANVTIPGADASAGAGNASVNVPNAGASAGPDNANAFVPGANANAGPGTFNGCIGGFCWNTH